MNCQDIAQALPDYFLNKIEDLPKFLKDHLSSCGDCSLEWKGALRVSQVFQALPVESVPAHLTENLLKLSRQLAPSSQKANFIEKVRGLFSGWQDQTWLSPAPVGMVAMFVFAIAVTFNAPQNTNNLKVASDLNQPSLSLPAPNVLSYRSNRPSFDIQNVSIGGDSNVNILDEQQNPKSLEDIQKIWEDRQKTMMEADADSLMMQGRRFKAMGRMDLALNDFETIVRFYPDYSYMGDVLMYRAQCYAFQGDYDKAINSLASYGDKYPAKKDLVAPMIRQLEHEKASR